MSDIHETGLLRKAPEPPTFARGAGNWCARYGQVDEWLRYQHGQIAAKAAKDAAED